ncbi:MAG: PEP-CTERM sorting domain-containing protein [Desulfobaccales bacterium]
MSKKLFALAAIFMLIAWAAAAHADYTAYDVPAPTSGNQSWTGSLGMDFNVQSPVTITALGVYDSGQDGISGTLYAVIYNRDTGQPVTKTLSFTTSNPGTLNDGSRFLTLTFPVTLVPGNYSVVSWGYSASDLNGNLGFPGLAPSTMNTGGGLISFVGSARFSAPGTGGVYPTGPNGYSSNSLDTGPVNRYYAGTFEFAAGPPVSTIAYNVPTNTTGNQAWTGSLGMDFNAIHPIKVTALGVYDSGQNGIISGPLYAVIYNRDTQLAVTSVLSFTTSSPGTLIGGSLFKTLDTPVILPPGDYSIVSWGYSASNPDGNLGYAGIVPSTTNTGNGLISFVGSARFSPQGTGGVYPTGDNGYTSNSLDGGPDNRYYAGTFEFTAYPAVPLPSTLLLLGSGMAGLGLFRFRGKT